jgi:hypothetical protein
VTVGDRHAPVLDARQRVAGQLIDRQHRTAGVPLESFCAPRTRIAFMSRDPEYELAKFAFLFVWFEVWAWHGVVGDHKTIESAFGEPLGLALRGDRIVGWHEHRGDAVPGRTIQRLERYPVDHVSPTGSGAGSSRARHSVAAAKTAVPCARTSEWMG